MNIKNEEALKRYEPDAWNRLKWQLVRDKWRYVWDIMYTSLSWVHTISTKFNWETISFSNKDANEAIEDFIEWIQHILLLSKKNVKAYERPTKNKEIKDETKVWWSTYDDWYDANERLKKLGININEVWNTLPKGWV